MYLRSTSTRKMAAAKSSPSHPALEKVRIMQTHMIPAAQRKRNLFHQLFAANRQAAHRGMVSSRYSDSTFGFCSVE